MIEIKLKNNRGFKWFSKDGIYVKGIVFEQNSKLLEDVALAEYFNETNTDKELKRKLLCLNGIFSVIIKKENCVLAATDPLRNFPLLYQVKENSIIISDACESFMSERFELNQNSSKVMKHFGYVTGRDTLIKDVFQIQGGELLCFNRNQLDVARWHTICNGNLQSHTYEEWKGKVKNTLFDVADRLSQQIGNSPVALPLSGGFDSRLIGLMLKLKGHKDVFCFTYGNPDHEEAVISKEIAKRLEFKWMAIDYKQYFHENFTESAEFNNYVDFIGNAVSFPYIQEFFAARYLKNNRTVSDNAIFIPGHSGDMLAGSHFFPDMNRFTSKQDLYRKIYRKNGDLLPYHNRENRRFIFKTIEKDCNPKLFQFSHLAHDDWNITQRQSKQIVNSSKVWNFFGYKYLLPLWDEALIRLFSEVPFEYRLYKKLYDDVLKELFIQHNLLLEKEKNDDITSRKVSFVKMKIKETFPFLIHLKSGKIKSFFYFDKLVQPMLKDLPPMKYKYENAVLSAWYIKHLSASV
jgi:asparagine synthase (glutamine-hydrolysing)